MVIIPLLCAGIVGETIMCPHCDVVMVYHQAGEELRCHYCEHHEPIPTVCPKCNSKRIKFLVQAHKGERKSYVVTLNRLALLVLIKM